MRDKRWLRLIAVLGCLMIIAAACGGGGEEDDSPPGTSSTDDVPEGGTLRIAGTSDVDSMDPAVQYYTVSWFLARGVYRTLTTYPADPDFETQNTPVADLATDAGQSNEDSTEWTFTLKDGINFGKALGGEDVPGVTGEQITSDDFKYAFERMFTPSVGAGYAFYYDIIEGADDFAAGDADEISGIETPDEKTIIFHLTEPAGDWPYRVAMPATAPVPRDYASKYDSKKDSQYEKAPVSSGPYYISEYVPEEQITMTKQTETWDSSTDDVRKAYLDEVDWKLGFDSEVGVKKVQDGEYDLGLDVAPTGPALQQTLQDPELKERFINEPSLCTRYIFMNTSVPPFDNQQVREAVNFAIDRASLKRLQGGPTTGDIAASIIPPGIAGALTADEFNPFETPNMAGDMDKAKQLMAEAGFPDGFDDELLLVGASDPPHDKYLESVRGDLEELGFSNLETKAPAFPNQYTQFYQVTDSDTAIGSSAGWCKDYNDAFTFLDPLFHGENINTEGSNQNYSELDDPELNALIDEAALTPPGDERTAKWEEANKIATELAVWVPWTWDKETIIYSENVVNPIYNTFFSHVDWMVVGVQ